MGAIDFVDGRGSNQHSALIREDVPHSSIPAMRISLGGLNAEC